MFRNWILREYHTAVSQLSYSHFSSLCCQANCVYGKLFNPHMRHEQLLLTAPVIGDVVNGPRISRCKCQVSSLRLQFMHVKSWHGFFHTRGVFVGVSNVKRVATMPSIKNTPHHQRDARIFSQCKVYLEKL